MKGNNDETSKSTEPMAPDKWGANKNIFHSVEPIAPTHQKS